MALDQIILEETAEGASPPTMRFLQFEPAAALVGYHQDVDLEIRESYCRENGIDVNRRITGGGGILFQESSLGWEIFAPLGAPPFRGSYEEILHSVCGAAAAGISRFGVQAAFRPRNDIEIDGRKISGTGGAMISGAFMFQGTFLVKNEVELFLKALRVPVEKLKKREIESLMDRICFLEDILHRDVTIDEIKLNLTLEFSERFGISFETGGLMEKERDRLAEELAYYQSSDWVAGRNRKSPGGDPLRSITQTKGGSIRVHLWPAPGGRSIRRALIVGDFFTTPARMIHDLEAALVGAPFDQESLWTHTKHFLECYDGAVLGVSSDQLTETIVSAADRVVLKDSFSAAESNELFLVNLRPVDLTTLTPKWLLLPYCSKNLGCDFREIEGCDMCGQCEIGHFCELAIMHNMVPITIQSFEHLMETLVNLCANHEEIFIGSCCEAFYAKHQAEMESVAARGVLVCLDSTTCYDLGKGSQAYKGNFDNKTELNVPLIEKTLRLLNEN